MVSENVLKAQRRSWGACLSQGKYWKQRDFKNREREKKRCRRSDRIDLWENHTSMSRAVSSSDGIACLNPAVVFKSRTHPSDSGDSPRHNAWNFKTNYPRYWKTFWKILRGRRVHTQALHFELSEHMRIYWKREDPNEFLMFWGIIEPARSSNAIPPRRGGTRGLCDVFWPHQRERWFISSHLQ
jgi:hypothetical protein